jgi:membrane-associated phospholipid phosphatase
VAYTVAMAFALTYFAEHYVFDILAGYVYAVASVWIVGRILDRRTRTPAANLPEPVGGRGDG